MEHVKFSPSGVCAIQIDFDIEDGKIYNLQSEAATEISKLSAS